MNQEVEPMHAASGHSQHRVAAGLLDLSVVIPVYDEEGNVAPLYRKLDAVLDALGLESEVIVVNDGSTDGTAAELEALQSAYPRLITIRLRRRFQKSAAYMAGFRAARGRIIVTMDGDGQDDPRDLPKLLAGLAEGYDLVSGWKKSGKGPLTKQIPSRVFNLVTARITRIRLRDFNCPFKAYRREVVRDLHLYGELHRFIPVLAHGRGYRIREVVVSNLPRLHGRSKYGAGRVLRGFLDLLTVLFLTRYTRKPLHFFGVFGISIFILGFGIALYLLLLKTLAGTPFSASFPMLLFSILLMVLGFQTFSLGFLSDLLVQNHPQELEYSIESIRTPRGGERAREDPGDEEERRLWKRLESIRANTAAPASELPLPPSKYRSRNPLRRMLVDRFSRSVLSNLESWAPAAVLEAGCGEGYVLKEVDPAASRLSVGIDRDRNVLRLARAHLPNARLVCGEVQNLPFRDDTFGAVCCLEVLEHLEHPEQAIVELARVSAGRLLLSVPWEPFFRLSNLLAGTHLTHLGSDPGHLQLWSRSGFGRFLRGKLHVDRHMIRYPWQIVLARPNGKQGGSHPN